MSDKRVPKQVRTPKHIRSMRSVHVNTGPGRHAEWPRLQETEQIARPCKGRHLRRPAGWAERRTR